MRPMSGKKFIGLFLILIVVSAIGLAVWIKQGYDSRPAAQVEGGAVSESCAAAKKIVSRFIEFDHAGQTLAKSPDVDALLDLTKQDVAAWDSIDLTRDSVVAGCREVAADQVEIVVSHAVYGSLKTDSKIEELEKLMKNEPKQMQSRVMVAYRNEAWKLDPATVYGPHISLEAAQAYLKSK